MRLLLFPFLIFWGFILSATEIQFTPEEKIWIQNHPTIKFGYEPHWEPYEIYQNGKYGGIIGEYVKLLEKKTGIEMIPIPNLTWEESMQGLINGSIMVAPSFVNTMQRKGKFKLTDPYIIDPIVVLARKDSPYFSTLEDMAGKTIAAPENYYTIDLITKYYPNIHIQTFSSVKKCLEALLTKKVDAYIGNINVISYYKNNYGFSNLEIVGVTPFKNNGICLVVNPEWEIFRNIANKVFHSISPRQAHNIRKEWIGMSEHKYFKSDVFLWTVGLFILLSIILLLIYLRNKSLKKGIKQGRIMERNLKTKLQKSEKVSEVKQAQLNEIHHRIKNNLQIVASMLNLQASSLQDEASTIALKEASDRIRSIALIHSKIYHSSKTEEINLKEYIQSIFKSIHEEFNTKNIDLNLSVDNVNASLKDMVPLAIIINELVTNSIQHAFDQQKNPIITIQIEKDSPSDKIIMKYTDNGTWRESSATDNFGTSLIQIFTEQIEGEYTISKESEGTTYIFYFSPTPI